LHLTVTLSLCALKYSSGTKYSKQHLLCVGATGWRWRLEVQPSQLVTAVKLRTQLGPEFFNKLPAKNQSRRSNPCSERYLQDGRREAIDVIVQLLFEEQLHHNVALIQQVAGAQACVTVRSVYLGRNH
jgi:hypothetical protein